MFAHLLLSTIHHIEKVEYCDNPSHNVSPGNSWSPGISDTGMIPFGQHMLQMGVNEG